MEEARKQQQHQTFGVKCAGDLETKIRVMGKFHSIKAVSYLDTNAEVLEQVFDAFLSGAHTENYSSLNDKAETSGRSLLVGSKSDQPPLCFNINLIHFVRRIL